MAKKLKKDSKEYAQRVHAIARCSERYSLTITEENYEQLCNYIRKGKAEYPCGTKVEHITTQTNRVTVWKIYWSGFKHWPLLAVYDKVHKTIATFLPPGLQKEEIGNLNTEERQI